MAIDVVWSCLAMVVASVFFSPAGALRYPPERHAMYTRGSEGLDDTPNWPAPECNGTVRPRTHSLFSHINYWYKVSERDYCNCVFLHIIFFCSDSSLSVSKSIHILPLRQVVWSLSTRHLSPLAYYAAASTPVAQVQLDRSGGAHQRIPATIHKLESLTHI